MIVITLLEAHSHFHDDRYADAATGRSLAIAAASRATSPPCAVADSVPLRHQRDRQMSGRHSLAADGLQERLPGGIVLADFLSKILGCFSSQHC